jgi:hypothetical protein
MRVRSFPSRPVAATIVSLVLAGCGGGGTPSGPSPTTRVIGLSGDLTFGTVNVGTSKSRTLTISDTGNGTLSFSHVFPSVGNAADFSVTPALGNVPAGTSVTVTLTYSPTVAQTLSGVVTVTTDATEGANTLPFSATAVVTGPLFTMSGTGNSTFAIPVSVTRLHIVGTFSGFASNFQVWSGASGGKCGQVFNNACHLLVNDLIGTAFANATSDNTLDTLGGLEINILFSAGVQWTVTEVR